MQFLDITGQVQDAVKESGVSEGVCTVFVPHTTAGITINENADPDVTRDIMDTLERLVPRKGDYRHTEGNADSHVKASLMGFSVDVLGGRRPPRPRHLAGDLLLRVRRPPHPAGPRQGGVGFPRWRSISSHTSSKVVRSPRKPRLVEHLCVEHLLKPSHHV